MDVLNKYFGVNIAKWSADLILILLILVTGCKTIDISTDDNDPPSLSLSVLQSIGELRSVTANSPSTENLEFEVAPEENISFLAVAFDPNGPKSIRIKVISGGQIEINTADETLLVTDHTFNQEVVGGTTNDRFGVGGNCRFDSPNDNMIIQAETEDFAGNIAISPKITLVQKNKVTATFTHSEIIRGEIYDHVNLNWQIENANMASIVAPTILTSPFIIRVMNSGTNFNLSESFTATLVAKNSVSIVRITLNVDYSDPGAPEILSFSTNPSTIVEGNSSTIRWNVRAGGPTIVNIEPDVYDGNERDGSRIVSPRTSQNYTLTAFASGNRIVQNREITVLPTCWSTPNREVWGASFEYRGVVLGWRVWDMELSYILPDSYVISKVTNSNSVLVRLWSGGEYVELEPGESSNFFNGLTVTRGWTLESPSSIAIPNIEFCFRG